ncbi:hypothetical protein GE21DRAFT_5800 [Neurospora crassa]|uniref:Uncharacterized protein n=1 Tax=Neurospora crassa (strain ATCC 24698 / 74-OR23-1A / CBS 708.71 / DSM 1257 / FGSC 987) TaxID=367110 RepID=Q7SA83_NEUCR|nr:hypothetical protein NCU08305 [Neurospora crassa OR74A]EAA33282.3 hypothetical protein NCU08305 [Neurospora crassa OR74A]KHE82741.1 hypothetical protein GE21DRAFT_5800 [Neurospora crassa]|eukprot:XP_962518.3 hypothetical protein NCU08305 [Neurospora crassa OR74A]
MAADMGRRPSDALHLPRSALMIASANVIQEAPTSPGPALRVRSQPHTFLSESRDESDFFVTGLHKQGIDRVLSAGCYIPRLPCLKPLSLIFRTAQGRRVKMFVHGNGHR